MPLVRLDSELIYIHSIHLSNSNLWVYDIFTCLHWLKWIIILLCFQYVINASRFFKRSQLAWVCLVWIPTECPSLSSGIIKTTTAGVLWRIFRFSLNKFYFKRASGVSYQASEGRRKVITWSLTDLASSGGWGRVHVDSPGWSRGLGKGCRPCRPLLAWGCQGRQDNLPSN